MQQVNEAWGVLRDADARRRYDESLRPPATTSRPRVAPPPPPARAPTSSPGPPSDAETVPDPWFLWLVRIAPMLIVVGVLVIIFVVTAFARSSPTPSPVPSFAPGTCVSFSGQTVAESPCDGSHDARVVEPDGVNGPCPANTLRYSTAESELLCLRPNS